MKTHHGASLQIARHQRLKDIAELLADAIENGRAFLIRALDVALRLYEVVVPPIATCFNRFALVLLLLLKSKKKSSVRGVEEPFPIDVDVSFFKFLCGKIEFPLTVNPLIEETDIFLFLHRSFSLLVVIDDLEIVSRIAVLSVDFNLFLGIRIHLADLSRLIRLGLEALSSQQED